MLASLIILSYPVASLIPKRSPWSPRTSHFVLFSHRRPSNATGQNTTTNFELSGMIFETISALWKQRIGTFSLVERC